MVLHIRTFICLFAIVILSACGVRSENDLPLIKLSSAVGDIIIEVDQKSAPKTSTYFLSLVDKGAFDGTEIYRVGALSDSPDTPKFLEGGMLSPFVNNTNIRSMDDTKLPLLETLEHTQVTQLKLERGSVFLGRDILGKGEIVPDFVIALEPITDFEYGGSRSPDGQGFPVFAKVVKGMEVVDLIAGRERSGQTHFPFLQGQVLTYPIVINASRIEK